MSNPSTRYMCDDPQSQSPPCFSSSGTGTVRSYSREEHNSPLCADSANAVHNMLVQTMLALYKAHWRPPRPPPWRKTGGASSPLSGWKKLQGRHREERRWKLSSKKALWEQAYAVTNASQSGKSAPPRADSACSALKQTIHRLCVSTTVILFHLQGGTHSL